MAANYFCIDFGEDFIKIADTSYRGNQLEISGATIVATNKLFFSSNSEKSLIEQAESLSTALTGAKINKKNVNIILPDSLSFNQISEMPHLNEKELLSAIKYQADQFIPMPIEDVSLDVEILHEIDKDKKILALISAAPKKAIERVQQLTQYVGLTPVSIETEISATGRLLANLYSSSRGNVDANTGGVLFVNFGYETSSLYFFNPALGLITHSHNFNVGYHLFMRAVQINTEIDEQRAQSLLNGFGGDPQITSSIESTVTPAVKNFVSEIQRFIARLTTSATTGVTHIFLFNNVLRFPALTALFGRYFNMPCAVFDLSKIIKFTKPEDSAIQNQLGFFISAFGGNLR